MADSTQQQAAPLPPRSDVPAMVKIWDVPQRIVHWALAVAVLTAWFTANVFDMVHEIAGYTSLALVAFRVLWGFVGPANARFANFVRPPAIVVQYFRRLMSGRTGRYLGHNPAGAAMTVVLILMIAVSAISGWMQLTERFFGVDWVELVHIYSSHLVLLLAITHVLGVVLMCVLQRENLVLAMITGRKRAWRRRD